MISFLREHFWQLVRFGIAGATAATIGTGALYLLAAVAHMWYLAASTISFACAGVVAFLLQKYWTFREPTKHRIPAQSAQSAALATFNLFFNGGLMYLLVDIAHVHYIVSQLLVYALIGAMDFLLYKLVIFKPNLGPSKGSLN